MMHAILAAHFDYLAAEAIANAPIHLYALPLESEWPENVSATDLSGTVLVHTYLAAIASAFRANNLTLAQAIIMTSVDPNGDAAPIWPGWMYERLREVASEEWLEANLPVWREVGSIGS